MKVELFFVRTQAAQQIIDVVSRRLASPSDPPAQQPDWGLPSSYDALLAAERRRKVALSPPINGWVAGVEFKEIVDFALLLELSVAMQTDVNAVQLSEVTGSCGYALCSKGHVAVHRFSDNDDDPAGTICVQELLGVP